MTLLNLGENVYNTAFVSLYSLFLEVDQVAKPSETALSLYSSELSICY